MSNPQKQAAVRKARTATAAASKPRARPKAKPTTSSLSRRRPQLPVAPLAAAASLSAAPASMYTVGDLRNLPAFHLDSFKRYLDALHGDSVGDLEVSLSRISKRFKMQTQSCLQLAEEADKEHRKMADKVADRAAAMKVTVPEMAMSVERAIDGLRSRYNIPATPA